MILYFVLQLGVATAADDAPGYVTEERLGARAQVCIIRKDPYSSLVPPFPVAVNEVPLRELRGKECACTRVEPGTVVVKAAGRNVDTWRGSAGAGATTFLLARVRSGFLGAGVGLEEIDASKGRKLVADLLPAG